MDVRMQFALFLLVVLFSAVLGQRKIGGNCWQAAQCNACQDSMLSNINGVNVCCPNCEDAGQSLSGSMCMCKGHGTSHWKPGLGGSGAIRGNSLFAYASVALVVGTLKSIF